MPESKKTMHLLRTEIDLIRDDFCIVVDGEELEIDAAFQCDVCGAECTGRPVRLPDGHRRFCTECGTPFPLCPWTEEQP